MVVMLLYCYEMAALDKYLKQISFTLISQYELPNLWLMNATQCSEVIKKDGREMELWFPPATLKMGKRERKNGGKEAIKKTTALKMQLMLGQNWTDLKRINNTPLHEQTNAATQQLSCGGTSPEYEAWYFRNLKIWNFLHRIGLVLGFMCVFQYCFRCVCFNNCSAYILKQSDNGKVKTSDANLSNSVQLCCKIW